MHDAFSNASDYSELEDDFLFLANEGQVALVPNEVPSSIQKDDKDDNRDVHIFKAEEDEEERALREYREKMAALLPQGSNFKTIFEGQKDLDANFEAFLDEEYDDGQIGEGAENPDVKDNITQSQMI